MILKYQLGDKDIPALSANKIKSFCEKILSVLQDPQKSQEAFQKAATLVDSLTTGAETRDIVKTQTFTDMIIEQLVLQNSTR